MKLVDRFKNQFLKKEDVANPTIEAIKLLCFAQEQMTNLQYNEVLADCKGTNAANIKKVVDHNMAELLKDLTIYHPTILPQIIDYVKQLRQGAVTRCAANNIDCLNKIYRGSLRELDERVRQNQADPRKEIPVVLPSEYQDPWADKSFFDNCDYLLAKMQKQYPERRYEIYRAVEPLADDLYDAAKLTVNIYLDNPVTTAIMQNLKKKKGYLPQVVTNIQAMAADIVATADDERQIKMPIVPLGAKLFTEKGLSNAIKEAGVSRLVNGNQVRERSC